MNYNVEKKGNTIYYVKKQAEESVKGYYTSWWDLLIFLRITKATWHVEEIYFELSPQGIAEGEITCYHNPVTYAARFNNRQAALIEKLADMERDIMKVCGADGSDINDVEAAAMIFFDSVSYAE